MVFDRFFVWVGEATRDQKCAAVEALVAALVDPRLGEDDLEAVEAALTLVADDADDVVRRRLAECLCEEDAAPRHILLDLLDDLPEIAALVAGRSPALIDAELVDVVAQSVDCVRLAVARRRRVGPTVATALAEAGDRETAVALLENPGADLPALALERLVERFGEFSDLRAALLARPHVPITVRHRVLEKLAEAIENLVVVKSWMGAERAGVATRDARDKATVALAGSAGTAETVVLVEHLRRTGQLTTRLLLRAACVGHLRFVEEALASLAGMPSARVAALVADGRESALRALYRKSAMPDRAWPAFHAAIEVHRELLAETGGLDGRPGDRARFARRLVERVLTRFTAVGRSDADDLLVLLRRYAAEAAREHVRGVMAERMDEAVRALPPPAPAAAVEGSDIASIAAEAVALELGVRFDAAETLARPMPWNVGHAHDRRVARWDDRPIEPLAEPMPVADETVPAPSVDAEIAAFVAQAVDAETTAFAPPAGHAETAAFAAPVDHPEADVVFGLFDHVRLEDLPPEWLAADEVAPEALWGDDDIPYRHTLGAETRETVAEAAPIAFDLAASLRGSDEEPAAAVSAEVPGAVEASEAVAEVETAGEAEETPAFVDAEDVTAFEDAAVAPETPAAAATEPVDPFLIELETTLAEIFGTPRAA